MVGDIGGFVDFVYYIGLGLMLPFAKFTLGTTLLSSLFDERSFKRENKKSTFEERLKHEFASFSLFPLRASLRDYCCDKGNLKKKIAKSNRKISRELDLQKFIHRQRVQMNAIMGLLSCSQQFFVHRLSKLYLNEQLS